MIETHAYEGDGAVVRLSRVEQQQRNRARVLAAARLEFAEHGYTATKVDAIAERAELTRGAVYSNFPGKRALYFAVLAELIQQWPEPETGYPERMVEPRAAAQAYVRAWLGRPTVAGEHAPPGGGGLGFGLLAEVAADESTRAAFAGLAELNAIMFGLGLERLDLSRHPRRRVRAAEAMLTMLYGAEQLSAAAPGFVDPFDLVEAAGRLLESPLPDEWAPPHLPFVSAATEADREWPSPVDQDLVTARPVRLGDDGVLIVLGLRRLAAVEEAVRAVGEGEPVTLVAVTGQPAELEPLARLTLAEGCGCLRRALPESGLPPLRVLLDAGGTIASAAGVTEVDDDTEVAIRLRGERIIAVAEGRGAGHAVASYVRPDPSRPGARQQLPR